MLLYPLLGLGALALLWLLRRPRWMGLEGRTLWDWVQVSAESVLIAIATVAITTTQIRVEDHRSQQEALQQYLDRIDDLLTREEASDMRSALARAHTATILQMTDGERAGRVLAFLDDIDLLLELAPDLEGLDLSSATLKGMTFDGLDLEGSVLTGADLEGSTFLGVDLEGAVLEGADLKAVDLRRASLAGVDLSGADLTGASLVEVDLSKALGLTREQLLVACFDATTTLPPALAAVELDGGCDGEADDDETDGD